MLIRNSTVGNENSDEQWLNEQNERGMDDMLGVRVKKVLVLN